MGMGAPAPRRDGNDRALRRGRPAAAPPVEPGAGPASGADHDRRLGDHRRPGDRALPASRTRGLAAVRRERRQPQLAGLDQPPGRPPDLGRGILAGAPDDARPGGRGRGGALALALPHEDRNGHPCGRRRPADDLGARHQHPGHLRDRVRRRRRARRDGRRRPELAGQHLAGSRRCLAAELARRRHHRRHGVAARRRGRVAAVRPRLAFSVIVPPDRRVGLLHAVLAGRSRSC